MNAVRVHFLFLRWCLTELSVDQVLTVVCVHQRLPWTVHSTKEDGTFYYNAMTGRSTWDVPKGLGPHKKLTGSSSKSNPDCDELSPVLLRRGRKRKVLQDSDSDNDLLVSKAGGFQSSARSAVISQNNQPTLECRADTLPVSKSKLGASCSVSASTAVFQKESRSTASLPPQTKRKCSSQKRKSVPRESEDEDSLPGSGVGLHRQASWMDFDSAEGRSRLQRCTTSPLLNPFINQLLNLSYVLQYDGFK